MKKNKPGKDGFDENPLGLTEIEVQAAREEYYKKLQAIPHSDTCVCGFSDTAGCVDPRGVAYCEAKEKFPLTEENNVRWVSFEAYADLEKEIKALQSRLQTQGGWTDEDMKAFALMCQLPSIVKDAQSEPDETVKSALAVYSTYKVKKKFK